MKPVIMKRFVIRDWETGRTLREYDAGDYETTWGNVHYQFYRQDLHKGLLHTATSEKGKGVPCRVITDHM
jgi:hypothetical protein